MLTVIKPATATNLTTIERARALLSFTPSEDAAVSVLIKQASRAIADHCRRPFGLETVRETFGGPARNGSVLLGRSPATAFVEVMDGSDVIAPESYRHDLETGFLFRVAEDGWRTPWQGFVSVTYTAGYVLPFDADGAPEATLPAAVERAAVRLVGAYLSMKGRDALIKSETTEGVGSTSWWVAGTDSAFADPEVEQLLSDYRRFF